MFGEKFFSFRANAKLDEFIRNLLSDPKTKRDILNRTGLKADTFPAKFKNALTLNIFNNALKLYDKTSSDYNQRPISDLFNDNAFIKSIDQVVNDFQNKSYLKTNTTDDNYWKRGLYPIPEAATKELNLDDFIELSLEREYIRKYSYPYSDALKQTPEFKFILNRMKKSAAQPYASMTKEELEKFTYEKFILDMALHNTYNNWAMFSSGNDTVATRLDNIIKNHQDISYKYPKFIQRFGFDTIQTQDNKNPRRNFKLVAKADISKTMAASYNRQWKDLANPVMKLAETEEKDYISNKYISDFFNKLPFFSFLQSGMDPSEFSMSNVMPNEDYTEIMTNASKKFTEELLNTDKAYFALNNFLSLFLKNNTKGIASMFKGRGLSYKKNLLEGSDTIFKDNVDTSNFITKINQNVYLLNDSYLEYGSKVKITQNYINDFRANNPDVIYLLTNDDLSLNLNVTTPEEIAKAKVEITNRIDDIVNSGKIVLIAGDGLSAAPSMEQTQNPQYPGKPEFNKLPARSTTPTMTYAGIGSRETPQEVLDLMTQAAKYLDGLGYTLNTGKTYPTSLNDYFIKTVHKGNKQAAEKAFKAKQAETERLTKLYGNRVGMDEEGADRAFSAGTSKKNLFSPRDKVGDREMKVGEEIHPNWSALSSGAAKLMARNTNQVFGAKLDTPVDFVLFYAQEVAGSIRPKGGTGQAVEMARRKGIPTINMADSNWREQLKEALKKKPVVPTTEAPASTSNVQVISPDYGVVKAETNPTKADTQAIINLIAPQIQRQAYKENVGANANWQFSFGHMWSRVNLKAKPLLINSFAGLAKTKAQIEALKKAGKNVDKTKYVYDYHDLDQDGNVTPSIKVLQPLINKIQNALGIDMSNYDSMLGNIYLDNQSIAPHRDTTEAKSAQGYPVVVYTIGNNSSLGIWDDNKGKMTFQGAYKEDYQGRKPTNEILTKDGSIYTFGMDGKGRFNLSHTTPLGNVKANPFPPITLSDGRVITNYTITLTFRRAADLEPGMPKTPAKIGTQAPTTNEVKGTIQLELIEDLVQQGKAKTTVRRYNKQSGVYKSAKGNLYDIVNRGSVKLVGNKIVGNNVSYTLDEFGAAEGFDNWENFKKVAKYAGQDLIQGKEVYLYDIKPVTQQQTSEDTDESNTCNTSPF